MSRCCWRRILTRRIGGAEGDGWRWFPEAASLQSQTVILWTFWKHRDKPFFHLCIPR